MKKVLLSILISSAFATTAIAQNIATVNGTPVPVEREKILIEQFQQMNPGEKINEEELAQLRDHLVTQEILYQEAVKQGLDKTPEFKEKIEAISRNTLITDLFNEYAKKNPIEDKAIQAEYQKIIDASGTEYYVRHILVEKEEDAKDIIDQLNKGADFNELAKTKSTDTGTAENGGLLDWTTPEGLVPEFAQAMKALGKGNVTQTPIKTRYGFHVIKVEDTRKPNKEDFPELDDNMKSQLRRFLQEKSFSEYQKKLIDAADVKLTKE